MNQVDQNINKDMFDSDLIDVESLDYSDDQTWLYTIPDDSGQHVDIVDWNLSCDWPSNEDTDYLKLEKELYTVLDNILKSEILALPDKHKFDSRTFVRPKKRSQRPSIQNIMEVVSNPPSMSPHPSLNQVANKYLTYNKYNNPLGPISPMLRLKTFNVDTNSENSTAVKEFAMKRRSLVQDDDPQLEDMDVTLASGRSSMDHTLSKPINIDLSQPAHNLHNTFNKWITGAYLNVAHAQRRFHSVTSPQNMALHCFRGLSNIIQERGSLNMYQSGESLMRMSPPSLVSSLLMESSGTFNTDTMDGRKSFPHKESGPPMSGRESIDPMMTSMTLSILDEKDMSTSFLSQTTYPDNDSLIDSLPPSLVSSVNSSYVISNSTTSKAKDSPDSNIFSSATFTNLEQSQQRLLTGRPRHNLYNSFTKREPGIKNSESYTKAREEACQIDTGKVLNENCDNKESPKYTQKQNPDMGETITYYSNNRFIRANDAEKENFERDDAFYKDMGLQKPEDMARNSLNVTLGKQELNEIIQARQKLSLARKGLPSEPEKPLPNQADTSPIKTIQLPNQTITVPRQSIENASELLSRRRAMNANINGFDKQEEPIREPPKRNATFKKLSPRANAMDTTVVYVKTEDKNIIDINSATLNLIDGSERTSSQDIREWTSQDRAMVVSGESTDTSTFSSSSPPDSVPDTIPINNPRLQIASTPLMTLRKGSKNELLDLHNTISPIYDTLDDKSYAIPKVPSANTTVMERTFDMHNTTIVSSVPTAKKSLVKRDILAGKTTAEKRIQPPVSGLKLPLSVCNKTPSTATVTYSHMIPPMAVPRKTGLPTSKLRQYSSHRELNRIPPAQPISGVAVASRGLALGGRAMVRRGVYASNPALSPTSSTCAAPPVIVTDSYTIANYQSQKADDKSSVGGEAPPPPALVRQGTETLRRERPHSQLVAPRDCDVLQPSTTRPNSVASSSQARSSARPTSGPVQKLAPPAPVVDQPRPSTGDVRVSALPRPSRLPAPRRALRPPSVYGAAAGAAELEHY